MNRELPSKLEDHLGYWLRCLSNFVSESFAQRLERQDVSVAQWVTLRTLFDHDALPLGEAAELVGVDKSSLSRMIERLVKKGWVDRADGGDRRSVALRLTPAGRKLVPKLARLADENDAAFFHPLSRREQAALKATIQRLLAANQWSPETRSHDRMT